MRGVATSLMADAVEKVPNCSAANFLLKDEYAPIARRYALRPVAVVAGEFIGL
jgi:hypothetical protein